MPIYATKCPHCGARQDVYRAVKDYDDLPECCGSKVERVVTAPYVITDIAPYRSMVTGEIINSRSQHRAHLKQHGKIEIGNEKFDPARRPEPTGIKEDVAQAIQQLGG
ncbi:putative FmdB family regulatory protein [Variovorax boronicumulans]|uniref:FmdB family zinc ribbon protein n=1 Tax=Variovorax boronicumulans TaxID=436515 RepID=UPI002785F3CD|nr:FmdB family zinc ribbon protein [Variovorax boronicumulans]MDQ0084578.1 putative FmdB family regulatory protein [Variovorax boronicumulans]